MPVVKCRRCGAVATAQLGAEEIETSYGASFRENCRELADRGAADFVSKISECPSMDTALQKLTVRVARQRQRRAGTSPAASAQGPEPEDSPTDDAPIDSTALAHA
jgi:hypothetical protein